MKTIRELILERHQSAEAKLKGIRAEDLAACTRSAAVSSTDREPSRLAAAPGSSGFASSLAPLYALRAGTARGPGSWPKALFCLWTAAVKFWQEALWPWRRAWIGIAASWVFILGFSLGAGEAPRTASARPPQPDPEVRVVLREQKQLLTQLLGTGEPPLVSRLQTPGPRSAAEPVPKSYQGTGRLEITLCAEASARA